MELSQAELYKNPLFLPLVLLLLSLIVWLKLQANGRKKLNLPPSPPKLPIIGNIHQLGNLPHQSLRDLASKYGSLLLLQLGCQPTLVVSSADMVKEIAENHDIAFSSRPSTTAANIMLYGCSDIGFAPYGEYWRQVRKICVVELLSLRRIHSFHYVREEELEVAMKKLRKASSNGEVVSMTGLFMAFANNVVSRSALSRRIVDQEDGESKFGSLARRLETLLGSFCVGDMFPYLKWIDVLRGFIASLEEVIQELDIFFDDVIEEHKDLKNDCGKDFVSILLQLQEHGKLGMELTRDNLKAIILIPLHLTIPLSDILFRALSSVTGL